MLVSSCLLDRTGRRYLPALWERGGSTTSQGRATVITKANGEKPLATYVRVKGDGPRFNGDHAKVVIETGMFVVTAFHSHHVFEISISSIEEITEERAKLKCRFHFYQGKWDQDVPKQFEAAITAAKAKATDYHCKSPYYVWEKP